VWVVEEELSGAVWAVEEERCSAVWVAEEELSGAVLCCAVGTVLSVASVGFQLSECWIRPPVVLLLAGYPEWGVRDGRRDSGENWTPRGLDAAVALLELGSRRCPPSGRWY